MDRPTVIVTTPVRDEAPYLPRFLAAALLWADAVILADQGSTDGSGDVARASERVTVIENRDAHFDEESRQRQLIAAARRLFPEPRILVALDVDELLSAEVLHSDGWRAAVRSPPGTCVRLGRAELDTDLSRYLTEWAEDHGRRGMFAYADDGIDHRSGRMHATRLPEPEGHAQIEVPDIVVLHLARGNIRRARSKERWYQCYERINCPELSEIEIRRRYDWYERNRHKLNVRACPPGWFRGYADAGVDVSEPPGDSVFWTDWEVLRLFDRFGIEPFARLDIWHVDWEEIRQEGLARGVAGLPVGPVRPADRPRDVAVRAILERAGRWRYGSYVDRVLGRALG